MHDIYEVVGYNGIAYNYSFNYDSGELKFMKGSEHHINDDTDTYEDIIEDYNKKYKQTNKYKEEQQEVKIKQLSTFENLKVFIYLTNEYGVPSVDNVDLFIENFGKVILNGEFTFTTEQYNKIKEHFNMIEKECQFNGVDCSITYGGEFYKVIGTKAAKEINDTLNTEEEKLNKLKEIIIEFDSYLEEIGMDVVFLENTPELIRTDSNGEEYIDIFFVKKDIDARGRLYTDKIVINADSSIDPEIKPSAYKSNAVNSITSDRNKFTQNNVVKCDIRFNNPSRPASMIGGLSLNGWVEWENEYRQPIDYYRKHDSNTSGLDCNKTPEEETEQKRADIEAAKIYAKLQAVSNTDETDDYYTEEQDIKHYELIAEYQNGSDKSLIRKSIYKNNEPIGHIVNNTEINVNGENIDVGCYIHQNKIKNLNELSTEFYWFKEIYREI